jgi:hypothetical protein
MVIRIIYSSRINYFSPFDLPIEVQAKSTPDQKNHYSEFSLRYL